jgi:hypothetical protein
MTNFWRALDFLVVFYLASLCVVIWPNPDLRGYRWFCFYGHFRFLPLAYAILLGYSALARLNGWPGI